MIRLQFILLFLMLTGTVWPTVSPASKPNILVLIADDAGWQDFGCYGNPVIRTKNIDGLAADGLLATQAFLMIPQCSPSRISILTGKYPHQTGAEDLHMPLPESEILLPAYLQKAGYYTGFLRKGHFGPNGEKQFNWYSNKLDDFEKYLDEAGNKPFFMWVGFTDPHRPYKKGIIDDPQDPAGVIVPPYLLDDPETRSDLADYYDYMTRMDRQIGIYLDILKKRKLSDNTLIIFFSDNGAPFPRAKGTVYDSGIGTPLIFSWPNQIKSGTRYESLISLIDLAPTILDVADLEIPEIMEGLSLKPVFKDQTIAGRKYIFSERNWHNCDEHIRSVRSEQYKLITNAYTDLPHGSPSDITASASWHSLKQGLAAGTLTPLQSMLFTVPRPAEELYDIINDPYESRNLIIDPDYQEVAAELRRVLIDWERQTNDFPPDQRRRMDNTDRLTGIKFDQTKLPPRPSENTSQ